jgi:hypothetical protein
MILHCNLPVCRNWNWDYDWIKNNARCVPLSFLPCFAHQTPSITTASHGSPSLLSVREKLEPIISLIASALAPMCTHPLLCSLGVSGVEWDCGLMRSGQAHSLASCLVHSLLLTERSGETEGLDWVELEIEKTKKTKYKGEKKDT